MYFSPDSLYAWAHIPASAGDRLSVPHKPLSHFGYQQTIPEIEEGLAGTFRVQGGSTDVVNDGLWDAYQPISSGT